MNGVIDYNELRVLEQQQAEAERTDGVPFPYFVGLSNLARELLPMGAGRPLEDVWIDWRVHLAVTDTYREQPELFPGFDEVIGLNHVLDRLQGGGVILTLHYGDYRHTSQVIASAVRTADPRASLALVVDEDSYRNEIDLPKWNRFREEMGCELFVAESEQVGLKLVRHLRAGGWLVVYLDGGKGVGVDPSPVSLRFLTSTIEVRSGLFRMLASLGKPVIPMLAERTDEQRTRLVFHEPVFINGRDLTAGVDACYDRFRQPLARFPEFWRFWFRHNQQVRAWAPSPEQNGAEPTLSWVCRDVTPPLAVDMATGALYRLPEAQ
ncbi:MAG TPA: hypothetical protein VNT75_23650 [Symbiobacteriaceae bacterium]|nr:hypothetical protein [Symbiobacteriaceae bacterium]